MRRLLLALPLLAATAEAGPLRFPLSIDLSYCETNCARWTEFQSTFAANGTFTTTRGDGGTWRARRGRITLTFTSGEVWAGANIGDGCATGDMYVGPGAISGEWVGCVNFP